jgi:hypothetical protein
MKTKLLFDTQLSRILLEADHETAQSLNILNTLTPVWIAGNSSDVTLFVSRSAVVDKNYMWSLFERNLFQNNT